MKKKLILFDFIKIVVLILFTLVLGLAWLYIFLEQINPVSYERPLDGVLELNDINLNREIGIISEDLEFYPNELYYPVHFEEGMTSEPVFRCDLENADDIEYGTYRVTLKGDKETYYQICGFSVDYGTRVFVEDKEVLSVGYVTKDSKVSIPRIDYMDFPIYTGETGEVELIIQYSNFVHHNGGILPSIYISTPQNIDRFMINERLSSTIIGGGLIILMSYFVLYGLISKKRDILMLAFCCLIFGIRDQHFYLAQLLSEDYNWEVHFKLFTVMVAFSPMAIALLVESIYANQVDKKVTALFVGSTILGIIYLIFSGTAQAEEISNFIQKLARPYLTWLTYCIIRYYLEKKSMNKKEILTIFGILILLCANMAEYVLADRIPEVTRRGLMPVASLIFIVIFMVVFLIKNMEHEKELAEVKSRELVLMKMSVLKNDFFRNMAHEIKTPLTIINGYAQLTELKLKQTGDIKSAESNLKAISNEAMRLSNLVSGFLEAKVDTQKVLEVDKVLSSEIMQRAKTICDNLANKNMNKIVVDFKHEYYIKVNFDMILQVFINLIMNANRHTFNGTITLSACENNRENSRICLNVADTGSGIKNEDIEKIFEKGFSGDNSSGLGLTICREIIESHGGELNLVSTSEKGTRFCFSVEVCEE